MPRMNGLQLKISHNVPATNQLCRIPQMEYPPPTPQLLDTMIGIPSSNSTWLRLIYVKIKHMWSRQVISNAEWDVADVRPRLKWMDG